MSDVTLMIFHPNLSTSSANKALRNAADEISGVESIDMAALYPDNVVDEEVEVKRLTSAKRLIVQFPIQWYSTPHLLKIWQNTVLTRMFYRRPDEGEKLRNLPVMLAVTVGNDPEAYTAKGTNLFSMEELLRPLQSTAYRCGWQWAQPFLLYRANRINSSQLAAAGHNYSSTVQAWIDCTEGLCQS